MTASTIGLLVLAGLIPIIGFVMTVVHARKGETRQDQRWRKSHGLLFWVLAPTIAGLFTILSAVGRLPRLYSFLGVALLAGTTFLSWSLQNKREEGK